MSAGDQLLGRIGILAVCAAPASFLIWLGFSQFWAGTIMGAAAVWSFRYGNRA